MEQQHAEVFQPETHPVEKRKPEERKDNVILFPQKEKEQGYEKYKASGGILSPEQYLDVLKRAANGTLSNSRWAEYARSMARGADIALSSKTEAIYGILREEQKEDYSGRSDQELLSEALRFDGDARSLDMFIKKHTNIFH